MADVIRLGFCGLKNRESTLKAAAAMGDRSVKVVACFDGCGERAGLFTELFPKAAVCADPEALAGAGIDAVVLGDCAGGTAKLACMFMEKGIPVLAGSLPAASLAEAVRLCRTAESTGTGYMFGSPVAFGPAVTEMKRIYDEGSLGKVIFAEGEYLADGSDSCAGRAPVFYGARALLPLLYITGEKPRRLVGRVSFNHMDPAAAGLTAPDSIPQILLETAGGAVFRVAASCNVYPRGTWFRIGAVKGGVETRRGGEDEVRLGYIKDDAVSTYAAAYGAAVARKYKAVDRALVPEILMLRYFTGWLRGQNGNDFDVYTAATVASVVLLGCMSGLDDGIVFPIPDFRIESIRRMYERDFRSPLPGENGYVNLPCRALPV